jgi:hypothetical protein
VAPLSVTVNRDSVALWNGALKPGEDNRAYVAGMVLPPGDTVLHFSSDRPGVSPGRGERRLFAFSVRNLKIVLKGRR